MVRRRGRPRKAGKRGADGRLLRESPRERAAQMPHRRGLGENAVAAGAECELGRMVLRRQISDDEGVAGSIYAGLWRAYLATICGPRRLSGGGGSEFSCPGCALRTLRRCECERRKSEWQKSFDVVRGCGREVVAALGLVAIADRACPPTWLAKLELGLRELAHHYGLTARPKRSYKKPSMQFAPASSPSPLRPGGGLSVDKAPIPG